VFKRFRLAIIVKRACRDILPGSFQQGSDLPQPQPLLGILNPAEIYGFPFDRG